MTRRSLFHHVVAGQFAISNVGVATPGARPYAGPPKGFRRLQGHADTPRLVAALRARYQRLGLGVSVEHVA